jgi:hypothetical protein
VDDLQCDNMGLKKSGNQNLRGGNGSTCCLSAEILLLFSNTSIVEFVKCKLNSVGDDILGLFKILCQHLAVPKIVS